MIIQVLLVAGLVVALVYALAQRRRSHWVAGAIGLASVAGIVLVLQPEQANQLARAVGVGRGADLILYCWIVISLVASLNLHLRIQRLQGDLTVLARQLAVLSPTPPSTATIPLPQHATANQYTSRDHWTAP